MDIKKIGVVGAGQMGRGIAQVAAFTGYEVVLFDVSEKGLNFGFEFISKQMKRGVEKGRFDQQRADDTIKLIKTSMKLEDMSDCDLIVEAATENKELKFNIFKDLDKVAKKVNLTFAPSPDAYSTALVRTGTISPAS